MTRPRIPRFVRFTPGVTFFKPRSVPMRQLTIINLELDEVETIRLMDLEKLDQRQAASKMKISVSTFQRILESARGKIADALINGKAIAINKK